MIEKLSKNITKENEKREISKTNREKKNKQRNKHASHCEWVIKLPINWNGALSVFTVYAILHMYIKAKKTEMNHFSFCW